MEQNRGTVIARNRASTTASYAPVSDADIELEAARQKLAAIRDWADRGEWRESGSDELYAILGDK